MTRPESGSDGDWGTLAEHDDDMAAAWDGFDRLPEPGVNDALDAFCAAKHLTIPALVRVGARLAGPTVLAFAYPGGIKYRNVETGQRWSYVGSEFVALKIVRSGADAADTVLIAEGESDAARLSMLYPSCDVAVLPAGARRWTSNFTKQLDGYARVLVALDNDAAGDAGAAKIMEHVGQAQRFAPPEGCKDWCEFDGEPPELPAAKPKLRIGRTASELLRSVPVEPDWLIPGVVARGWTVKIAGREKLGKGTFIFLLLGCLERGEATVFGPASEPVSAVVFTEEPEDSIREKVAAAGLDRSLIVYGYELGALTWPEKVDTLVSLAIEGGHGLIFADNVSRAAAVDDEAGVELARAVELLSNKSKAQGLAVIVDHHHRKGAGRLEDMSRGGTAIAGATENNIEMERVGDWDSRARRISSRGRVSATIWTRTIELAEDGSHYRLVADVDEPQAGEDRRRLGILEDLDEAGATAKQFAAAIGKSEDAARATLTRFVEEGRARVEGSRPRRYIATAVGGDDEPGI